MLVTNDGKFLIYIVNFLDFSGHCEPELSCSSDLPGAEASCASDLPGAGPLCSTDLPSSGPELDVYQLGKTYFDLKEYDRAAFFTKSLTFHQGISNNNNNITSM